MNERDIERLFAGSMPADDPELGDLARFFADLGEVHPETATASCEAAHLAAMVDAVRISTAGTGSVPRPADEARGLMSFARGPRTPGHTATPRGPLVPRLARVAAVAASLALVFGGVAFAGALPGPVQDAVAGVARTVGIDMPDSDGEVDAGTHDRGKVTGHAPGAGGAASQGNANHHARGHHVVGVGEGQGRTDNNGAHKGASAGKAVDKRGAQGRQNDAQGEKGKNDNGDHGGDGDRSSVSVPGSNGAKAGDPDNGGEGGSGGRSQD